MVIAVLYHREDGWVNVNIGVAEYIIIFAKFKKEFMQE